MTRPKRQRRICSPPLMSGFKPFGIRACQGEMLILAFDEYESIRLCDYENLTQEEASEKMNISRPTFTRIYEKARKIIAKAFVEGKAISIQGGNVQLENQWFKCSKCFDTFQVGQHKKCCEDCDSNNLVSINQSLENQSPCE
jgi:uncharacterized protein